MGANTIKLKVLTAEGIRFNGIVVSVTVPSLAGEITLLAQHIPLLSALKTGKLRITDEQKKTESIKITSGFVRFINNTCTITIEEAKLKQAS